MKKKKFITKEQAEDIYLPLLDEKQERIDSLRMGIDLAETENACLRKERDNINRLFHEANKETHRQMAVTRYVILINLMMDTLAKTLDENIPMGKVILKAINNYKTMMAEGMLLFKYDGESCLYDPTDEDTLFDFHDNQKY